jgi:hypothetical protein
MKSIKTNQDRIIIGKLSPDDDVIDTVTEIVTQNNIKSGSINIIGALKKLTLGYFVIEKKEYQFKTFEENVELVSCMGNIAFKEGEPIIHLHCVVARDDYSLLGGHLGQPSIISVTGEVIIHETQEKLQRTNDPRFDLSLLKV